jgi:hypothetical protein
MSATVAAVDLTKLRVGKSHVFIGSFLTVGLLVELGLCEGGISAKPTSKLSTLTLPEVAGDTPILVDHVGDTMVVDIPLIIGDPLLWAKLSPLGLAAGGVTKRRAVTTTSMLIVPESEMTGSPLSIGYAATTWSPVTAPKHAIFIPKGYFIQPERGYEYNDNGSKKVIQAQFVAMLDDTQPDKYKVWFQDAAAAVTAGVTLAI